MARKSLEGCSSLARPWPVPCPLSPLSNRSSCVEPSCSESLSCGTQLRRWREIEDDTSDSWLPGKLILAIDLSYWLAPHFCALEESSADDNLIITQDVLLVVRVSCAVAAEEAVCRVARIALVGVLVQLALGDLELVFWNDLVQSVFAATDDLASTAVAEDVCFVGYLSTVGDGTAMALAFILWHYGEAEMSCLKLREGLRVLVGGWCMSDCGTCQMKKSER